MIANTITIGRTLYTFLVIALLGRHRTLDIVMIFSIALIFALDAVDGIVARHCDETSETGVLLDTLADRIIENTFWIYFTGIEMIPLWIPIAVMTRGILTDTLRSSGDSPTEGWGYALTRAYISRGLYGALKMFTFICLASCCFFENTVGAAVSFHLALLTVSACFLRALPTLIEIYKTKGKPTLHAKHLRPLPKGTESSLGTAQISKKTVR